MLPKNIGGNVMHTLSDLKASEVKLRESLKKERIPGFKSDIRYALRIVRVRRKRLEGRLGIGKE